jgi:hypothetical protein
MLLASVLAVAVGASGSPAPEHVAASPAAAVATPAQPPQVPAGPPPFEPSVQYDANIPTLPKVLGFGWADEISSPDQIAIYLRALAEAAPTKTRLIEYARSWEGRPLHVLVVGSPERVAALDRVKAGLRRLADPRGLVPADAERLLKELPVVTWLVHGVHGNEISSPEAALVEAYHLLAAQRDQRVETILRESIVLIDPLQNPDGRARFIASNRQGRAASPDPEPAAAEHDEPWPGGRSNHYLFDMNRDWFAQSQPETRGRTAFFLEWYPHVVVDLHEMGANSTYYFAPPADPLNPYITKAQIGWLETFGRENGRAFDDRGFAYFNREVFDSFYPGYGESWPIFHGAIGMTYEMASARGLVVRREDDTLLTYRDGVHQHFTAALTTMATAASNRERLLRDFLEYRRSAVSEAERGPVREYLIPPGGDPPRAERLARLLVRQGFEVRRASQPIALAGRTLPAGTFLISAAQPGSRLLRNLLDTHVPQPEAFVKEQDRRRKKRLPDQIYDMTGWSLPLAFDVEIVTATTAVTVASTPLAAEPATTGATLPPAKVGYLMPWGSGTASVVAEALQQGLKIRTASAGFTLGGRAYPAGTAIVRVAENQAAAIATLGVLAARQGCEVVPIDSAFVESGVSLGSNQVATLTPVRVLLAWDVPTQSMSAGWARYALERRFGQRVTAVRTGSLGRVDLRDFDVVVLPGGNYGAALGADAVRRLKDWIGAGGTLVTIGEASRWAARENVGLLETRTELRDGRPEAEPSDKDPKKPDTPAKPFDLEKAIQPDRERPEPTPGALLRVTLDAEHWLSAGTDGEIQVVVEGQRVFRPITLDKGRNVGVYQVKDKLVAGGLAWPEAQELLAQKAFLVHQPMGQGHVIAFAEDPNYRAFTEAAGLLFINAVLLGPAY